MKFSAVDYVGDVSELAKFRANPFSRGRAAHIGRPTWIGPYCFSNFLRHFLFHFREPADLTIQPIVMLDGRADAAWCNEVPFGILYWTTV
jgi:hypothetical protein